MCDNLVLQTKGGDIVRYSPNEIQQALYRTILAQQKSGNPGRVILYKFRQKGGSAGVAALFYTQMVLAQNQSALVAAHDDESCRILWAKVQLFHAYLNRKDANSKLPKPRYDNRKELIWGPPHNSKYRVQVGIRELDRGGTNTHVHCSELGFWLTPTQTLNSVLQTVPNTIESVVVLESTPNGDSGEFYNQWCEATEWQAKHPGSYEGFFPLFYGWIGDRECRMRIPRDYSFEPFDAEERHLIERYKIDREQLYWRRWTIRNKCLNDVELFHQEYPGTPSEGFLSTGRHAIPAAIREYHHWSARRAAPQYAELIWLDRGLRRVELRHCEMKPNCWQIYEPPSDDAQYSIGGDPAEEKLSDPTNPRSESDFSVAAVLNRRRISSAAQFRGKLSPMDFGDEMLKAGIYYHDAWLAPEINGAGVAVLDHLKNARYQNIYRRRPKIETIDPSDPRLLGWRTSDKSTRQQMIADWIDICREDPIHGWRDRFYCNSLELAQEEDTFSYDENGVARHARGKHDDALFAWMIAWQCHMATPYIKPSIFVQRHNPFAGMEYAGGVDPGLGNEETYRMRHVG